MSSNLSLKPILTGGVIVAIDKFALKQQNMNSSLYFGLAGAVGIFAAQMVVPMIPKQGSAGMIDFKTLETRVLEVGLGAGATYGINRFVLHNDLRPNDLLMKVGVIAAADFIGEYLDDYIAGRPLSFFK
jgi:hypothetical protein